MKRYSLASIVFVLAGCASLPTPAIIRVPVVTPCKISAVERPDTQVYKAMKSDSITVLVGKLAAREIMLKEYILKLEAGVKSCQ